MKRIFVAINISDRLKKKISIFRQKYNNLPVRWIVDENLHLTLMPPIELNDNQIVVMIEKLKTLEAKIGIIKINFNLIALGPNPRKPRIIWAEGEKNQQLLVLKNKINEILSFNSDRRLFRPHLTLARFRPKDYFSFPFKNLSEKINWREDAISFSIIQSERMAKGAVYTILDTINS
jgi:2'-5' RNA ligase